MTAQLPDFPPPPSEAGVFQPFWEAVAGGRLELPHCPDCGRWVWYPAPRCPGCTGARLRWMPVAGTGSLFTYTVVHRSFLPGVAVSEPFTIGLVELDGVPGPRLVALLDAAPDQVRIGMRLRVRFDAAGDRLRPVFEPVEGAASASA